MLHGRTGITLTLFVFDVLAVEGLSTTMQPYSERRAILEQLDLENQRVKLVAAFEHGEALFAAVCERGLEGVVAKRGRDPLRRHRWGKIRGVTDAEGENFVPFPATPKLVEARIAAHPAGGATACLRRRTTVGASRLASRPRATGRVWRSSIRSCGLRPPGT